MIYFFFFFQAEDGIRDADVTGVQTCALPISGSWPATASRLASSANPRSSRMPDGGDERNPPETAARESRGGRGALVESVPNFSEGRRADVEEEIVNAFTNAHPEVLLLDRSSDPDHNRSVVTLAGPGPALVDAVISGAAACVRLIDLTRHGGVHPRMGALDVVPFVPLDPACDCVPLALEAGRRLVDEIGIPVYLYGAAARVPSRAELPSVRAGGFEELALAAGGDPARAPDLGGPGLHPTAGATAVGVRPFLIAYNVNLATEDVSLARRIARAVRARDGGLPAVRALGLPLEGRRITQVSMNLLDFRVAGLVPQAALTGIDLQHLKLQGFSRDLTVEERIRQAIAARGSRARQQGGFSM